MSDKALAQSTPPTPAAPPREAQRPAAKPTATQQRPAAKPSAIMGRTAIERRRGGVERVAAIAVLLFSFIGSAAAFSGWSELRWGMVVLAILIQIVLTWVQWAYRGALANISRAIDAALTAAGFGPLIFAWALGLVDPLLPAWEPLGQPVATLATWGLLWLVCLLPAWWPESRLIQEEA